MRALTLWQPWAAYIARGGKDVENRGWKPADEWTGTLLIHAGQSFARWPEAGQVPPGSLGRAALAGVTAAEREAALSSGAIVAVAQLTGYHRGDRCSVWAEPGCWHWTLEQVTPIEPVPCRGQRGLWTPSAETLAVLRDRLAGRGDRLCHHETRTLIEGKGRA
jgi:hypothetical protein